MPDYFTLDELRAVRDMEDETRFSDDRCEAAAAYIVAAIEREVGTSFIGRPVTGEAHSGGTSRVLLDHPFVLSVEQVVCNGVTYTTGLTAKTGVLTKLSTSGLERFEWPVGIDNVVVDYTKGYSTEPPADIKEQAIQGTRSYLLDNDSDAGESDRITSSSTDSGTENYIVAGLEHPTGYPKLDATMLSWKEQLDVHGFA